MSATSHTRSISPLPKQSNPGPAGRFEPVVDKLVFTPSASKKSFKSFKNLVVFGDSYSTSRFVGSKTWIDFIEINQSESDLYICKIAYPGATAEYDLSIELESFFYKNLPKDSSTSPFGLDPLNTCYVFFFGINDCGRNGTEELEDIVERIVNSMHELYVKASARYFIIIDVPPMSRSPAARNLGRVNETKIRVDTWNELLQERVDEFAREIARASVTAFSAHALFDSLLDDLTQCDDEDSAWNDGLHASELVHEEIADGLLSLVVGEVGEKAREITEQSRRY